MWNTNPYYNPEAVGLTIVAEAEDPEAYYTFNKLVVWTDGEHLLWATDSGCSCPSPFEDTKPQRGTKQEICAALDRWVDAVSEYRSHSARVDAQKIALAAKERVRGWARPWVASRSCTTNPPEGDHA